MRALNGLSVREPLGPFSALSGSVVRQAVVLEGRTGRSKRQRRYLDTTFSCKTLLWGRFRDDFHAFCWYNEAMEWRSWLT